MAEGLGVLSHAFFRLVFQNSVDRQWLKLFGNSRLESCGFARCAKKKKWSFETAKRFAEPGQIRPLKRLSGDSTTYNRLDAS